MIQLLKSVLRMSVDQCSMQRNDPDYYELEGTDRSDDHIHLEKKKLSNISKLTPLTLNTQMLKKKKIGLMTVVNTFSLLRIKSICSSYRFTTIRYVEI